MGFLSVCLCAGVGVGLCFAYAGLARTNNPGSLFRVWERQRVMQYVGVGAGGRGVGGRGRVGKG